MFVMIPFPLFLCSPQVNKLVRCLSLLKEYVIDCDDEYSEERGIPPHGKYVSPIFHTNENLTILRVIIAACIMVDTCARPIM